MQLDAYHTFMLTAETKISSYYSVNCAQLKRAPNSLGKIKKILVSLVGIAIWFPAQSFH